ncbi:DUF4258 domain-containing protein [Zwartia vadi]|uniref:DUF4258 domain-containing protein n=1 Tax=Zwartia vadi TaxID=3058168 RepID=UPI00338F4B40
MYSHSYTIPIIIMGMINVIPLRLNDANALRIVRALAAVSANIYASSHAKLRMQQRNITLKQVLCRLRSGFILESAHLDIKGDWRLTMRHSVAGDDVKVAVALKQGTRGRMIVVITVF